MSGEHGQINARVAQLVEHDLAKVGAAGSSPVSRSLLKGWKRCIYQRFRFFYARENLGTLGDSLGTADRLSLKAVRDTTFSATGSAGTAGFLDKASVSIL